MRNLALLDLSITPVHSSRGTIAELAFNLDDGSRFIISELINGDGDVEWEIWKLEGEENAQPALGAIFKGHALHPIPSYTAKQLVTSIYLPDQGVLSLITRGGDIVAWQTAEEGVQVEVVGSVEEGITAAAWSPDDSILVLVTGHSKIIFMTSTFDVLSEAPLHPTEFGSDAPINVGWGSKQTQFHGSLGKAAAQTPSTPLAVGASPDDDGLARVSWRGDGLFVVVSSLSPGDASYRTLRVYDRTGALHSTSEAVPGLEHVLAWRPTGPLIAATQRFGFSGGGVGKPGRHDLVFFERNGLRHGEFSIRPPSGAIVSGAASGEAKWGYRVREVLWNASSDILALWIEAEAGDIVQLWTTGNYHWYLKQEIIAPRSENSDKGRFTSVAWHPEEPFSIILTTHKHVIRRMYAFEIWGSSAEIPQDSGSVVVVDGGTLLFTPFRTQNVPPPMSSFQLSVSTSSDSRPRTPVHVAFSSEQDLLAVLHEAGHYQIWNLQTRLGPGKGKIMDPVLLTQGSADKGTAKESWRQIVFVQNSSVGEGKLHPLVILGKQWEGQELVAVSGPPIEYVSVKSGGRLLENSPNGSLWWQSSTGDIHDLNQPDLKTEIAFTELCDEAQIVYSGSTAVFVGLSRAGRLHASTLSGHHLLSTNVTSFTCASGFIIYTTTTHEAFFAPLITVAAGWESTAPTWETRRIERGARIVCAVPSTTALVLQMPRGNLETIAPRPIVMAVIQRDIDAGEWRKAFISCRKHRIDLAVLVIHSENFIDQIPSFVEQVNDVDFFGLFLTTISRSTLPQDTVNSLCDAIRGELERLDLIRFTNSVLTALVVKSPPEHEEALRLLLRLRGDTPNAVDGALKYLVFLVDADVLFDIALGMYDFGLVLLVAQHAKKDPREYLPFLRHLRGLPSVSAQRFAIDDHLRRHTSALQHLHDARDERFEEAMGYAARHRLLPDALRLWAGSARESDVLAAYGEDLMERREWRSAALVFVRAGRTYQALAAWERALEWRVLFSLAISSGLSKEEIQEIGYRIAEDLGSKKRHEEAGRVLLEYCEDVRHAVIAFVEGSAFGEARRAIAVHERTTVNSSKEDVDEREDLLETVLLPGLLDAAAQIRENLDEIRTQIDKQRARVRELRVKKLVEPDVFYGEENPALAGVDVMTDVSQPGTAYTRYTAAPTTASRTSTKRSSRAKRKADRNTGKKGTAEEEEYLLRSVVKLVTRFGLTCTDVDALVLHLLAFTPEHRAAARVLLANVGNLRENLTTAIEEIWTRTSEAAEQADLAARLALAGSPRVEALDKVEKPELPRQGEWRDEIIEALIAA